MQGMTNLPRWWLAVTLFLCLAWTLFINGAVPWMATPTIGQAASMLGYAQAFADQHWYAIHARSFGYPVPAALATGLPLAWVAAWFLRLGMASADAYSAAVAVWLMLGFVGAWRLSLKLGTRPWLAAFAAAAWMSMPMVWGHQGYSSLGVGMALLPLYAWSAWNVLDAAGVANWRWRTCAACIFVVLCIVALFMDGYTFMMFSTGAALAFAVSIASSNHLLRKAAYIGPVYVAACASAYLLYAAFIGRSAFEPASLDFFRGWAVDLTFLAKPTRGELWLWDWLGWARVRDQSEFYGDASVWTTSFVLPVSVIALGCLTSLGLRDRRIWPWLVVATFGMYMALGPTLKIGATKPPGVTDMTLAAHDGVIATGNGWISEHVPGFRNMRAAYRWEALFVLGLWAIVCLRAGKSGGSREWAWAAAYVAIAAASIPDPRDQWMDYTTFHRDFSAIDRELAAPLARALRPGALVFFAPWTNDILPNYLAPKAHVVAYNVSGDKQLDIARASWPRHVSSFAMGHFDASDAPKVRDVLLAGEADAVVVPFFDGLNASHVWPCAEKAKGYSAYKLSLVAPLHVLCPDQLRADYAPGMAALRDDSLLAVDAHALFAVVRLRPEYAGENGRKRAIAHQLAGVTFPLDVIADPDQAETVLGEGWHGREAANRWSTAHATMLLPVPAACKAAGCAVRLTLAGFAASVSRPLGVSVRVHGSTATETTASFTLVDGVPHVIVVPLPAGLEVAELVLDVPRALSPSELGMSSDPRVLGVSISRIELGDH